MKTLLDIGPESEVITNEAIPTLVEDIKDALTPAAIGALATSGGTVTGNLNVSAEDAAIRITNTDTPSGAYTEIRDGRFIRGNDYGVGATVLLPGSSGTLALTSDIPSAGTNTPEPNGTADAGSANTWSKSDHVHPAETEATPDGYVLPASAFPITYTLDG